MMVRVLKSGKSGYWYANKINDVFEIITPIKGSFYYETIEGRYIEVNDSKIIKNG